MKILHAIMGLPRAAGTTIFCVRVAEEQARAGHTVAVALRTFEPERYLLPRGCEAFAWRPGDPLPFEPDVVHVHTLWAWWTHEVCRWARARGIRIVLSPHGGLAPWAMAHKRWKKFIPWHLFVRSDVARAAILHATAPLEMEWIRARGFENPIVEVPLGVDIPSTVQPCDNPRRVLLFVGRIYPVKGLDLLIPAWYRVFDFVRRGGWVLRLVGPDQDGYRAVLERLVAALDPSGRLAESIEFTGPIYGDDLRCAYDGARALVLPSYTENFGSVVLDALAHARPVLTSEATPWDFLAAEGCGWHFPLDVAALAERLERLLATPDDVLAEMGARGRALVERRYAWSEVARRLVAAYEGVCGRVETSTRESRRVEAETSEI